MKDQKLKISNIRSQQKRLEVQFIVNKNGPSWKCQICALNEQT